MRSGVIVFDDVLPAKVLERVQQIWPAPDWPGWIRYDPAYECKVASDLQTPIPAACGEALAILAALPIATWFGENLVPDLGLHGSGLHEVPRGNGIDWHLDADTHARLGVVRCLSAVAWVHERWDETWGGELEVSGLVVSPQPNRLVVFDCREVRHRVRPVTADVVRRSLALFWYGARSGGGRRRARFEEHPERGQAIS